MPNKLATPSSILICLGICWRKKDHPTKQQHQLELNGTSTTYLSPTRQDEVNDRLRLVQEFTRDTETELMALNLDKYENVLVIQDRRTNAGYRSSRAKAR